MILYILNLCGLTSFALDECGWWNDVLYRSKLASNTYTPTSSTPQDGKQLTKSQNGVIQSRKLKGGAL